ncbi:hypothetical protein GPECTOR_29g77 [Gonium pectorale]|uniref:S-adenosyl-L-methionine-dependent methyltransferase n=1 Tax=Gonium pectorale TaxID=33097 RepID=A0A150GEN9_GONPE|nr:hypothetical protein GPECTOR_29g77 [Gonium pectorale]|eukprot:KXZ48302.1 hypothetical protein GPECTOR_29g77 [Gonium pectorale]
MDDAAATAPSAEAAGNAASAGVSGLGDDHSGRAGGGGAGSGDAAAVVTVFELDSGSVETLKTSVLGRPPPHVRRVFVRADLAQPEQALSALAAAGHDASRPTAFVAEGLIGYLSPEAGDDLLCRLRSAAAPGSWLVLTVPPSPSWRDSLAVRGVRLHHVTYEEPEQTLARARTQGWDTAQLVSTEAVRVKYGLETQSFIYVLART